MLEAWTITLIILSLYIVWITIMHHEVGENAELSTNWRVSVQELRTLAVSEVLRVFTMRLTAFLVTSGGFI